MSASVSRSKIRITKNTLHCLREVIYKMYARKDKITVETIFRQFIEESPETKISKSSLYLGIKKMGFHFKKRDGRKQLLEMPGIRLKRILFLNKYHAAKSEKLFTPVFLDETWIFSKSGDRRMWQDGTKHSDFKKTGSGTRYVIVHAGNKNGFVANASLIFKCNKKTGDYHDNMNTENFENWFKKQLIVNLEEPSLIIMDNATYHSRLDEEIPRKSWSKTRMLEWLKKKNIPFPDHILKDAVWNIIEKQVFPEKNYHLDKYAAEHGHCVLRLPPYHCHFNAIEMVWSETKRHYDQAIMKTAGSPTEVLKVWNDVVNNVPEQHWQNYIKHTEKIISEAWEVENKLDLLNIEPMVISVSNESDDELSLSESYSDLENN